MRSAKKYRIDQDCVTPREAQAECGCAVRAYIGLGSNLADPLAQLRQALSALSALPACRLAAVSSFYRSVPMGPPDQPDYINAVAALDTNLAPLSLLDALQGIEHAQGRVRGAQRWGPRTLDLDLVLFGDQVLDESRLTVPHPGLRERNFVLVPLHELVPDLILPGGEALAQLMQTCSREGLEHLVSSR